MSLGSILKDARERKGLTIADVAEQTHLLPQMVEEIEQDDFHRFAAAIYGRGFIRLYAECVGENPEPLVQEFSEIYSGARRPVIATRPVKTAQEDVRLVESSTTPSGRPRIKTRVVETAPEEAEEPSVEAPQAQPAAAAEREGEPLQAEESRDDGSLGDLFAPRSRRPEGHGSRPVKVGRERKEKGAVPFDPFVDEPHPEPGAKDPVRLLSRIAEGCAAILSSPRALAITGGVICLVVVLFIVSRPRPARTDDGDRRTATAPVAAGVVPVSAGGRPVSFSSPLLPPPDTYVE